MSGSELALKKANNAIPVDLIRTVAIVLVILLHAATEGYPLPIVTMSQNEVARWWTINFFNSIARPAVPLFIMLTGALLLQPSKVDEHLRVFFKKRASRIALPFLFWGVAYFAWDFLVEHQMFSWNYILQGVLTGPYTHFWFLYLLVGLYFITPIIRIIIAYANAQVVRYFLLLWFTGTALVSLLLLSEGALSLNANIFIITGWLGYFIIGAYIYKINVRRIFLWTAVLVGLATTIFATYLVVSTIGQNFSQIFYDAFSANMIVASVALFVLLCSVSPLQLEHRFPKGNKLIRFASKNTLAIYLMHIMVLETLQRGYLGFSISLLTMNSIVEIPLATMVTFFVCLGILYPLNKIPLIKRLVG